MYFGQGVGPWIEELYFTPPGDVETYIGGDFYRQDNLSAGPASYPATEVLCVADACSDFNYLTQQTCADSGTCSDSAHDDLGQTICESDANGYCDDGSGQTKQLCIDEGTCSI